MMMQHSAIGPTWGQAAHFTWADDKMSVYVVLGDGVRVDTVFSASTQSSASPKKGNAFSARLTHDFLEDASTLRVWELASSALWTSTRSLGVWMVLGG